MINDRQATVGISAVVGAVRTLFFNDQRAEFIGRQREAFDEFPDGYNRQQLSQEQRRAKLNGDPFQPDIEQAEQYAESSVEFGVGQRLKGAYACYRADMQLECIRHLLLALDSVCVMLKWEQASAYLNEQNRLLLDRKRAKESA